MRFINSGWTAYATLLIATLTLAACGSAPAPAPRPTAPAAPAAKPAAPPAPPPAASIPPAEAGDDEAVQKEYARGLAALTSGNDKQAEKSFVSLTKTYPELAGPHFNLAILYYRTGRLAEAEEEARKSITFNGENPAPHNYLGMIYRAQGKFNEARAEYESALKLKPDYAYVHRNLGILYDLYLGDLNKAAEHYQRYQQLAPNDASEVSGWLADIQQRTRTAEAAGKKETP